MHSKTGVAGWVFLAILFSGLSGSAQIRVPRLVSDGMVLQRDIPIRIWGFGSPGEKVTVKFDGQTASSVTADNGKWIVELSPKKGGGPYTMDIDGINHIWLKNIMVGEVWVCMGQNKMEMPMGEVAAQYADLIAHADNAPIRQFRIAERYDFKGPRENVPAGHWETASPSTVLGFSALGYLFARKVYDQFHVPVGLINAAVADVPAEAWLSPWALRSFPDYANAATLYTDSVFAEGKGPADKTATGGLHNGMLAPAATYTVRGILWWQGEANLSKPGDYEVLLKALINDSRRWWSEGDLPFIYVQLEGHGPVRQQPEGSQWAELREAQRLALGGPGVAMAVAADLSDSDDLRGKDLDELARRLFLAAEGAAYDKSNVIYTGPLYSSMKAHGKIMHVLFDDLNTGLIVKGGGELKGFEIAGADQRFLPAKAIIDGKKVYVWNDAIPHPMAVRYAWADNPAGANLYNRDILFKDGLPASPFEGGVRKKIQQ
jgi:sialate O-acetylesterase